MLLAHHRGLSQSIMFINTSRKIRHCKQDNHLPVSFPELMMTHCSGSCHEDKHSYRYKQLGMSSHRSSHIPGYSSSPWSSYPLSNGIGSYISLQILVFSVLDQFFDGIPPSNNIKSFSITSLCLPLPILIHHSVFLFSLHGQKTVFVTLSCVLGVSCICFHLTTRSLYSEMGRTLPFSHLSFLDVFHSYVIMRICCCQDSTSVSGHQMATEHKRSIFLFKGRTYIAVFLLGENFI